MSTLAALPKVTDPGPLCTVHRTETGVTKSSQTVPSSDVDGNVTDALGPASTSGAVFSAAGQSVPVRFTKVSIPPGEALTLVSRMLALASGSESSPASTQGMVIASSVAPDGIVSATTWYGYPANASFAMTRWLRSEQLHPVVERAGVQVAQQQAVTARGRDGIRIGIGLAVDQPVRRVVVEQTAVVPSAGAAGAARVGVQSGIDLAEDENLFAVVRGPRLVIGLTRGRGPDDEGAVQPHRNPDLRRVRLHAALVEVRARAAGREHVRRGAAGSHADGIGWVVAGETGDDHGDVLGHVDVGQVDRHRVARGDGRRVDSEDGAGELGCGAAAAVVEHEAPDRDGRRAHVPGAVGLRAEVDRHRRRDLRLGCRRLRGHGPEQRPLGLGGSGDSDHERSEEGEAERGACEPSCSSAQSASLLGAHGQPPGGSTRSSVDSPPNPSSKLVNSFSAWLCHGK